MHQSAIVLVRLVPGSSLLSPPYWKARSPWGRGWMTRLTSTWRKNVMSMRELYCPSPLAGFEKMAGFHKYFFAINKTFPLLAWEEQAICLQKLQAVVITFLRLNFL